MLSGLKGLFSEGFPTSGNDDRIEELRPPRNLFLTNAVCKEYFYRDKMIMLLTPKDIKSYLSFQDYYC
jgi:hypothetical protein